MATIKRVDFERTGVARGMKIAAFVLVLTAAALVTDHMGIVAHGASHAVAQTAPGKADVAPTESMGAMQGFALPESLRPTQADVHEGAPTF